MSDNFPGKYDGINILYWNNPNNYQFAKNYAFSLIGNLPNLDPYCEAGHIQPRTHVKCLSVHLRGVKAKLMVALHL